MWYIHNTSYAAKLLQLCPTLCDPIDGSPPGSAVPGILQARILEWVAISFSNAWKWQGKVKFLSCVRLLATPWTAACQAPPSMGFFSRQEYWSGLPLSSPIHHIPGHKISMNIFKRFEFLLNMCFNYNQIKEKKESIKILGRPPDTGKPSPFKTWRLFLLITCFWLLIANIDMNMHF